MLHGCGHGHLLQEGNGGCSSLLLALLAGAVAAPHSRATASRLRLFVLGGACVVVLPCGEVHSGCQSLCRLHLTHARQPHHSAADQDSLPGVFKPVCHQSTCHQSTCHQSTCHQSTSCILTPLQAQSELASATARAQQAQQQAGELRQQVAALRAALDSAQAECKEVAGAAAEVRQAREQLKQQLGDALAEVERLQLQVGLQTH